MYYALLPPLPFRSTGSSLNRLMTMPFQKIFFDAVGDAFNLMDHIFILLGQNEQFHPAIVGCIAPLKHSIGLKIIQHADHGGIVQAESPSEILLSHGFTLPG